MSSTFLKWNRLALAMCIALVGCSISETHQETKAARVQRLQGEAVAASRRAIEAENTFEEASGKVGKAFSDFANFEAQAKKFNSAQDPLTLDELARLKAVWEDWQFIERMDIDAYSAAQRDFEAAKARYEEAAK